MPENAARIDDDEHAMPKRRIRTGQFWRAKELKQNAGAMVNANVESIRPYHDGLVENCRELARAFGVEDMLFPSGPTPTLLPSQLASVQPTNVYANILESMQADIYKNRLVPVFVTDRGSWRAQRQARDLSDFIDGVEYEAECDTLDLLWGLHVLLFGVAISKCVETAEGRIGFECVPRWEMRIDPLEARYRKPRTLYHRYCVDRGMLFDRYGRGDLEGLVGSKESRRQAIDNAVYIRERWQSDELWSNSDMVTVTEAYHLPSGPGATDGRFVLTTSGDSDDPTLVDRPFTCKRSPFSFLWTNVPLATMDGVSVARRILPNHRELARIDENLREGHDMASKFRVWLGPEGQGQVSLEHFNDLNGAGVRSATKPEPIILTPFGPDYYGHRQTIKQEMYEVTGSNQSTTNGSVPAGMKDPSGVALQMQDDQYTQRHAPKFKLRERFVVDRAECAMDLAEELATREEGGDYEVIASDNHTARPLKWSDVKKERQRFVLKCFSTSGLPKLPGARMTILEKLLDKGVIDVNGFRKALDSYDLKATYDLDLSLYDVIRETLDRIVEDGEYLSPEPFDDLPLAAKVGRRVYAQIRLAGDVDAETKALVQQFIEECDRLLQKPASEGAPAAPGGPPGLPPPDGGMPMPGAPPGGPMPPIPGPMPPGAPPGPMPPPPGIPQAA